MEKEDFEVQESVETQTETVTSVEKDTKQTLDSFPRIEDLRKSEQDVKVNTQVEGTTQVEQKSQVKDKIFTRKEDERKVHLKKRLKIVTAVYTTVVALLLAFVITNFATLFALEKSVTANTKTIKSQSEDIVEVLNEPVAGESVGNFQISLNEPRDYSEDKKDLTLLDKITILFRNLFG